MLNAHRLIKSVFVLLFMASAAFVSAQVEQTAELKVTINSVITFELNDANPTLVFDETDDFINGVSYSATNAGTITSAGAYSVIVLAEKNYLEDSAGNKISTKSISLEAKGSDLGTLSKVKLNSDKQTIIANAPAAISKTFDLTYSTEANDTEFIGKPEGDYTVELVFIASLD